MTERYYNVAADLLVTASVCMKQGKVKKALECAELALQTPDMTDLVNGMKKLNTMAGSEIDDEEEVMAKSKKADDDEFLTDEEIEDAFEEESRCKKCKAEDEEVEEIEEVEDEADAEEAKCKHCKAEDEDEEIDDEELDEVLSSLRTQFKVTSSIKTKPTLSSKVGSLLKR